MMHLLSIVLLATAPPVGGAVVAGEPTAFSGDELVLNGNRIRLHGIAAPRLLQNCRDTSNEIYECGRDAQTALTGLVEGQSVRCTLTGDGSAICNIGSRDIAAELIQLGFAVPTLRYPPGRYRRLSLRAQAERRGIWRGRFIHPEEWEEAIRTHPFVRQNPPPATGK